MCITYLHIIWKAKLDEEGEREHPLVHSPPAGTGLVQSQEPRASRSPVWLQGCKHLGCLAIFPAESWIRNGAAGSPALTSVGCPRCRWRLCLQLYCSGSDIGTDTENIGTDNSLEAVYFSENVWIANYNQNLLIMGKTRERLILMAQMNPFLERNTR